MIEALMGVVMGIVDAIPIIIDCDGDSCMELSDFEKVADHLDAIILVHLNGNCGNLNQILKLCKKFSIEIRMN